MLGFTLMDFDDSAFYFHFYYHFSSLQTILYTHLKTDNAQFPFSLLIENFKRHYSRAKGRKYKKPNISPLCE